MCLSSPQFAIPAKLSAPIGDFDASPKVPSASFVPTAKSPVTLPTEDGDDFSDFGSSQPSDSVPASAQVPAEPEVQSTAMPTVASFSSSTAALESDEFSYVSPAKACLSSSFSEPAAPPAPQDKEDDGFGDFEAPPAPPAPKGKEDDGFGDFEAPPAPPAPQGKEDDGFGDFEAPPAPPAPKDKEDDGFGDFADAPARAVGQTREDDDGFGGFADANTPAASAVKADDVRKRDHSQPACACNLSLCVARLHSQDFGDFDAGGSATATTDFSSAPAPVPLPVVPTPAPTAPGLVPAAVVDGPDPTALKLAAADALLHVLPTSAQLQSTGMTGCPTLDQMLSQQVRSPPKECACACHDLVRLAFRIHHRWDSQGSPLGIRRFGRPSSRHRTLGRGRTLFSSRAFCRHSECHESKIPHLPVQK